jgi:hypothetical protein
MKTLRRDISYNMACSILEANRYGITEVRVIGKWTLFHKNSRVVARYNERRGILQV